MFDWFKKPDYTNVVKFPEPKAVPNMPYVEPPKQEEKPAIIYYRLGITDNNRVSFAMGYSEITLNKTGIQNMINHLAVLRDQLHEEAGDE